jgi:hypothetical protein
MASNLTKITVDWVSLSKNADQAHLFCCGENVADKVVCSESTYKLTRGKNLICGSSRNRFKKKEKLQKYSTP